MSRRIFRLGAGIMCAAAILAGTLVNASVAQAADSRSAAGQHVTAQPATTYVEVPDLIGSYYNFAYDILHAADLYPGSITYRYDYSCDHIGEIFSQTPAAGTLVPEDSTVDFVYWGQPWGHC